MSLSFSDAAKAKALREYFARHGRIYIVVDATSDDVLVPEGLKGDPALRLVLNSRMPQPILIRDDRLESEFSFSGKGFACRIPMQSIWAAYLPDAGLEQGIIWDEDVPELIRAIVKAVRGNLPERGESAPADSVADEEAGVRPGGISVIDGGVEAGKKAGRSRRKSGHLKVVK